MFRKLKWVAVWAVFLSLPLLALSPVSGAGKGETQRTVEEVHQPNPSAHYGAVVLAAADQAALPAVNQARWYEFWSHQVIHKKKIPKHSTSSEVRYGTGACGGNLPPCWVMNRESGGNLNAYNPTGCNNRGCRGKWQCDPRTCSGQGTEEEQDAEAAALWDNGNGCEHWAACG